MHCEERFKYSALLFLLAFAALGTGKVVGTTGARLVRKTAVAAWQQLQPCERD